jgi:hypothetical protein
LENRTGHMMNRVPIFVVLVSLAFILNAEELPLETASSSVQIVLDKPSEYYDADLNEGIDFTKPGYPRFIEGVAGMSKYEKTHRWTDANLSRSAIFKFKEPLPKRFALILDGWTYRPSSKLKSIVKVGSIEKYAYFHGTTYETSGAVTLWFDDVHDADMIEITPAIAPEPLVFNPNLGRDSRHLGIALKSIKIRHGVIFELSNKLDQSINWLLALYYRTKHQLFKREVGPPPNEQSTINFERDLQKKRNQPKPGQPG